MAETAPIVVIDMQEGRYWGDCPMCGEEKRLDHAVGWYEEAVHEEIGAILPHGGEVGGKCVCRECHDRHYAPGAATMTAPTPTAALTPEELAAKLDALDDETMCFDGPATYALIREAAGMIRTLASDNEQLNASFDLRHKADARAIKQWQEVTGRTMSMPDQADLCVFLLMALDMSEARATTAEAVLSASLERERALREALEGVVRVADRKTVEFDKARAALAQVEGGANG